MSNISSCGDALTVTMPVRCDATAVARLQTQFNECARAGYAALTIDLSRAEYVDSSGLGLLLYMHQMLGDDAAVRVCGARGQVLSAIKLCHLDRFLGDVA